MGAEVGSVEVQGEAQKGAQKGAQVEVQDWKVQVFFEEEQAVFEVPEKVQAGSVEVQKLEALELQVKIVTLEQAQGEVKVAFAASHH